MADRADITPELCRQLLRYEPETGKLYWLRRPREMFDSDRIFLSWNAKWPGNEALSAVRYGPSGARCRCGSILSRPVKAHRVAWAITHGRWPISLDHINGDPTDNRLSNLREVTQAENQRNMRRPSDNKSGRIGVCWNRKTGKWLATIKLAPGKQKYLGDFRSFDAACRAREKAERELGYHANHGRS